MSVVMLFGAGALVGLVALTAVIIVTLLTEDPDRIDTPLEAEEPGEERPAIGRSVL
ncbi:hypothetical protein [Nocardiopsis sp. CC223A]|uniref:hypothetical protein n=1 Tax=Nocardiopsis sp. CC223A TaxID=3044051 RepID=UPI00278BAF9E|nr:hypothetical protein [Nocardiopsis sp. CC223A]